MKSSINILLAIFVLLTGCKKFLDEKSNQKLVVISSIGDLQAIIENSSNFNEQQANETESSADNYFLSLSNFNNLEEYARNQYTWNKDNQFIPGGSNSWVSTYLQVFNTNIVLENIVKVDNDQSTQAALNTVKGEALFIRSKCFFQIAQIWALGYDPAKASSTPGIPLRLNSNFNEPTTRSTLEETYTQILNDLRQASTLLPVSPIHVLRPSKPAAFGLLARVFLSMNKIDSCLKYTNLALGLKSTLMDYNGGEGINLTAEYPFQRFNPEVIYDSQMDAPAAISTGGNIDKSLYDSYATNDLRKTMFHRSGTAIGYYKGSYAGSFSLFNGIATDELILMSAECLARQDKTEEALKEINKLLIKRWKKNTQFIPITAATAGEALDNILTERRKEMVFRGLRWMDIKRLNIQGAKLTLTRNLGSAVYKLDPNDRKYALAIPEDIISRSGIAQNDR